MATTEPRKMHTATMPDGKTFRYPAADVNVRIDEWIEAFDGHYRFALPMAQIDELQRKVGCSLFELYGRVMRGRYEAAGEPIALAVEGVASPQECWETIRLGLIGGGMAYVDDKQVTVDAVMAKRLVENYVQPGPVVDAWGLAAIVIDRRIHGRPARPEEEGSKEPAIPLDALPAGSREAFLAARASRPAEKVK